MGVTAYISTVITDCIVKRLTTPGLGPLGPYSPCVGELAGNVTGPLAVLSLSIGGNAYRWVRGLDTNPEVGAVDRLVLYT